MCHFVLPGGKGPRAGAKLDGRYADEAMALFVEEANSRGTHLTEYQAKIFGGGNMLANSDMAETELVGTKNIESAVMLLSEREIPLLFSHVGKNGHRRIAFDVTTGDVWVKYSPLQKTAPPQGSP